MIVIVHERGEVTSVFDAVSNDDIPWSGHAADALPEMARQFPERLIGWCEAPFADGFNSGYEPENDQAIYSYFPGKGNWLPDAIGYVEDSLFLKVPDGTRYPTWLTSPVAGVTGAKVLQALPETFPRGANLGYFLHSLTKLGMTAGLSCYAEPALLKHAAGAAGGAGTWTLFRFVAQHYKKTWVFLLFYNMLVNERKFPVLAFLHALCYRRRRMPGITFPQEGKPCTGTLDVLIPTIGREQYLYDVLGDLAAQTVLPQRVVIVEQNPDPESVSGLSFLTDETWPFRIHTIFTHETGACQARNRGLGHVDADWIFFADDDIRIPPDFIGSAYREMGRSGGDVFTFSCVRPGEAAPGRGAHQTSVFGAGCSILSRRALGRSRFDPAYEFGFGEDMDFGKRLMDKGFAIRYLPHPEILHLKAPMGGFRTKHVAEWAHEAIQPKPSPTVMRYRIVNQTREQLAGYRSVLMFNMLAKSRNPFSFVRSFRRRWDRSRHWAALLPALRGGGNEDQT